MSTDETIRLASRLLDEELGAIAPAGWDVAETGTEPEPKPEPRTYANQFGAEYAPHPEVLGALTVARWDDTSWGNDVAPSWESPCGRFRLWCHPEEPKSREVPTRGRFVVEDAFADAEPEEYFSSDNAIYVSEFVRSHDRRDRLTVDVHAGIGFVGQGTGDGAYDLLGEGKPVAELVEQLRDYAREIASGVSHMQCGKGTFPTYLTVRICPPGTYERVPMA